MYTSKYEIILKVAETGNFTRTAEYFQYSQSAISQTVKSVEKELGIILFHRTGGTVTLSNEGKKLLPYIREIVIGQRHLSYKAGELKNLQSGIVRIGAYLSLSTHWLPGCIRQFQKIYPNIEFKLYQADDAALIDYLHNGSIDLAFMSDPKKREFNYRELFEDPFVLIVPEGHALSERKCVTVEELDGESLISLDVGYGTYLKHIFSSANIHPKITYRMIDDLSILSMVEQGHGLSILPKYVTTRNPFRIKTVSIFPEFSRHLGVVSRAHDYLSWAAKTLLKFILIYHPENNHYTI